MLNAAEMAEALGGDPTTGKAHCPAHEDKKMSLSLTDRDGKVLWKCHAGCSQEAVTNALRERGLLGGGKRVIATTYGYTDAKGKLLFQVVRYEPKDFRQRRPDGEGGWNWKVPAEIRVLYQLPDLLKAVESGRRVFLTEGEKDADRLIKEGLAATCNPGGAGKWDARYSESLKDANVVLLPDNDNPGKAHAEMVARELRGIAKSVKVIHLPGLPPKGDVSKWMNQGGAIEDLKTLAMSAREWTPGDLSKEGPQPEFGGEITDGDLTTFRFTDHGNAERLAAFAGENLRYCYDLKSWLVWDGGRWKRAMDGEEMKIAKSLVRRLHELTASIQSDNHRKEFIKNALVLESVGKCDAMLKSAKDLLAVQAGKLDSHPNLFNVQNGTLDLDKLTLRPADRADMLTQQAGVSFDREATCPTWDAFLEKIFGGNSGLIAFVQRCVGYSLTGDTGEQVFFLLHGDGSNGKSTLIETIMGLWGDYAKKTAAATFLEKKRDSISEDLAMLKAVRFAGAVEPDPGRAMAESLVKEATGGDKIRARRLYENSTEYSPQFKLWLACNRLPRIRGTDLGIWRRIMTVPFAVTISEAERDKALLQKLRDELPGILNWCLAGLEDYYERGLAPPVEATKDKEEYRDSEDQIGRFLVEACAEFAQVKNKVLRAGYEKWADESGETPFSARVFKPELERRGYKQVFINGVLHWKGISLLSDREAPPDAAMRAAGDYESGKLV